jgi:hypothetical protein
MANTDAFALQKSDLNGFLFADIGIEASGNNLSVLSALARVGMDPWQEGGRLAKLPKPAAIDALAKLIAIMPSSQWSLTDATAIASRLVALLPGGAKIPAMAIADQDASKASQNFKLSAVVFALLATMAVGYIWDYVALQQVAKDGARTTQAGAVHPADGQ